MDRSLAERSSEGVGLCWGFVGFMSEEDDDQAACQRVFAVGILQVLHIHSGKLTSM